MYHSLLCQVTTSQCLSLSLDAFPIGLTTLNLDASVSDINYFTAEVTFRYDWFDYKIREAAEVTDASMMYQHITERGDVLLPQGPPA